MNRRVANAGYGFCQALGRWTAVPVPVPVRAGMGENPVLFRFAGSNLSRPVSGFAGNIRRRVQEAHHLLAAQVAVVARFQPGILQEAYLDAP